jgi:hypothetical protein
MTYCSTKQEWLICVKPKIHEGTTRTVCRAAVFNPSIHLHDCATKCRNTKHQITKRRKYKTSNDKTYNLTKRRNTKCRILQNVEIQNVENTKGRTTMREGRSKVGFGAWGQTQPSTISEDLFWTVFFYLSAFIQRMAFKETAPHNFKGKKGPV